MSRARVALGLGLGLGLGACGGRAPGERAPEPAPPLDIRVVDAASQLGRIAAFAPDGAGLAQRRDRAIVRVDPTTGAELGPGPALPPARDCALRTWGPRAALVCDLEALYRLRDDGSWELVTRAVTGSDGLWLSDDGAHAAYLDRRCPGELGAAPVTAGWQGCVFGPDGWRRAPDLADPGAGLGLHGAAFFAVVSAGGEPRVAVVDADRGTVAFEALPRYAGHAIYLEPARAGNVLPDGTIVVRGQLPSAVDAAAPAGLVVVRAPDGRWAARRATDAPRERWGVRLAFADARHGVAAGSFYRHLYTTVDQGRTWTAIAGVDPGRDARFSAARLQEDSALPASCDVTGACRIDAGSAALVVRFPR